ncbi:hypothetical protein BV913_03800 [Neisseria dumasiana]|uniref:Uncharacterized protein n=1 Tax=Neisseria dumasiana TaxID=1931275 RepID=A0ABX3WPH5_9NEIS|nr:hypothetical protein BV913_03800 [Neisseria dumasiana]
MCFQIKTVVPDAAIFGIISLFFIRLFESLPTIGRMAVFSAKFGICVRTMTVRRGVSTEAV